MRVNPHVLWGETVLFDSNSVEMWFPCHDVTKVARWAVQHRVTSFPRLTSRVTRRGVGSEKSADVMTSSLELAPLSGHGGLMGNGDQIIPIQPPRGMNGGTKSWDSLHEGWLRRQGQGRCGRGPVTEMPREGTPHENRQWGKHYFLGCKISGPKYFLGVV